MDQNIKIDSSKIINILQYKKLSCNIINMEHSQMLRYKENYDIIQNLPLVVKLRNKNKKLKDKIKEMEMMVAFSKESMETAQQMLKLANDQLKYLNT